MVDLQLYGLVEECASRHSAHLIDLVVRGGRNRPIVEAYIDTEAGVTTELCAEISRDIGRILDTSKLIAGSYDLTVSSPGIDRPLKYPWQYAKHRGREIRVRVKAEAGAKEMRGKIVAADELGLILEVGKNNERVPLAFDAIVEAMVTTPW